MQYGVYVCFILYKLAEFGYSAHRCFIVKISASFSYVLFANFVMVGVLPIVRSPASINSIEVSSEILSFSSWFAGHFPLLFF